MTRWIRWSASALLAFFLLPASAVFAHAAFLGASISDGSVLSEAPPSIELAFNDKILLDASSVELVYIGHSETVQLPLSTKVSDTVIVANLPVLLKGQYVVRFTVVDPADLHKTVGSISFGVGVLAPYSNASEQITSSWLSALLRALSDVLIFVLIGISLIAVRTVKSNNNLVDEIIRWVALLAIGLASIWFVLVVLDIASVGVENINFFSLMFTSDPGRRAVIGLPMAYCLTFLARLLRESEDVEVTQYLARALCGMGVILAIIASMGGHTPIGGNALVGLVIHSLHLYSLGAWVGVLAVVYVVTRKNSEYRWLWSSATQIFTIAAPLVIATGIFLTGRVAVTVTSLLTTNYGWRLIGKLFISLVMLLFGFVAGRLMRGGKQPRIVNGELALALIAVCFASTMATSAPAVGKQYEPLEQAAPQILTGNVQDLTVNASLVPALTGPNMLQVRVLNTRKPAPGVVANIVVTLYSGDGIAIAQRSSTIESGVVEWNDIDISVPGDVRIRVDINRPESPVAPFVSNFNVLSPTAPTVKTVVSDQRLQPFTQVIGLLLMLCVLGIAVLGAVRNKNRTAKNVSDSH
jgi:methionine-rich copper-binding protein CopC/putative copper export protein